MVAGASAVTPKVRRAWGQCHALSAPAGNPAKVCVHRTSAGPNLRQTMAPTEGTAGPPDALGQPDEGEDDEGEDKVICTPDDSAPPGGASDSGELHTRTIKRSYQDFSRNTRIDST